MKNIIFVLIILIAACSSPKDQLFTPKENKSEVGLKGLTTLMEINTAFLQKLVANKEEKLDLSIPYKGSDIDLELEKVNMFTPDFVVRTDQANSVAYTPGIFYNGKIKGDATSVVSLSIFNDEVNGIISSESLGNLNLGKTQEVLLEYMLADPDNLGDMDFVCGNPDEESAEIKALRDQFEGEVQVNAVNNCVSVDLEMSYSTFQQFRTTAAVTNWITSIMVSVKTLYKNEGIELSIKSIFVWTTPDGYDPNPATTLNQLRAKRTNDPNFTGSVVQFVRGKTGGYSGIAYLDATCNEAIQYGVSDVSFSYNQYPAYSWTVMVIAHEMGHNFGARHTQWCGWVHPDGHIGAIDNCYTTEGGCAPGPAPVGGGTVQSYCHMTSYGINFTKGWGPLPGNALRAHIAARACSPCATQPPAATCTDGVKNGTETGIDCGGSCPPCPVVVIPISQGKPARMSSQYLSHTNNYPASMGNDGIINGNNFFHTAAEVTPFWEVDLGQNIKVSSIRIVNRTSCCIDRVVNFMVFVSASPLTTKPTSGWLYKHDGTQFTDITKPITGTGRYVRIWVENPQPRYMNLAEVSVWGVPGAVVCDTIKIPVTYRDSISCK